MSVPTVRGSNRRTRSFAIPDHSAPRLGARGTRQTLRRGAYLTVRHGPREGSVFELVVGVSTIGRGRVVDIRIDAVGVSRVHAKLLLDGEGNLNVTDCDSTNGTYVNGRRVRAEGLRDGDRVRLGPTAVLGVGYVHPAEGSRPWRSAAALSPVPSMTPANAEIVEAHMDTLAAYERALGPKDPELVRVLEAIGTMSRRGGRIADAERYVRRALQILEAQSSPSPVVEGHLAYRLGCCALDQGRHGQAIISLQHAQRLLSTHEPGSMVLPRLWFTLARVMPASELTPRQRRLLAQRALDACAGVAQLRPLRDLIRQWLVSARLG